MAGKLLAVFIMLLVAPLPACAQVTCGVSSAGVSFGPYAGSSHVPDDATGSITVSCTAHSTTAVAYSIALLGTGGSGSARTMRFGGERLTYQLYSDPTHTEIWGNGAGGTRVVSFSTTVPVGHTDVQNFTVYGRIPAGQKPAPGAYEDEVGIAVVY